MPSQWGSTWWPLAASIQTAMPCGELWQQRGPRVPPGAGRGGQWGPILPASSPVGLLCVFPVSPFWCRQLEASGRTLGQLSPSELECLCSTSAEQGRATSRLTQLLDLAYRMGLLSSGGRGSEGVGSPWLCSPHVRICVLLAGLPAAVHVALHLCICCCLFGIGCWLLNQHPRAGLPPAACSGACGHLQPPDWQHCRQLLCSPHRAFLAGARPCSGCCR